MSIGNPLLHEVLRAISNQADTLISAGPLSMAFHNWVLAEELPIAQARSLVLELSEEVAGGGRSIQTVGALGFLLSGNNSLIDENQNFFVLGVDWLMGRSGDSQTALTSLMQPVALTGVLIGLAAIDNEERWREFGVWFTALFAKLQPLLSTEGGWRSELLCLIKMRCDVGLHNELLLAPINAGAALFVARRLAEFSTVTNNDLALQVFGRIKSVVYDEPEPAAIDLAVFRFLAEGASWINLRVPSLQDVGVLLRRLQSGLRRWTWDEEKKTPNSTAQKWAIENEYHFQNLLWAVLAPLLPDLRDEEWLASVGQKKPRADLVVPSLHLVIEVKYWRTKTSPQDLISQIAEDVGLYLKYGSPYSKVLPIIWDQGRRVEQHDLLTTGLCEIRDVVSPVIIAQPAFMV